MKRNKSIRERKPERRKYHRKYWEKNKEKIRARHNAYRKNSPEKFRERDREYREKHPEIISKSLKKYRLSHREKISKYHKRYMLTASGIFSSLHKRHRHVVKISKEKFLEWYNSQEKICVYCGIPEDKINSFAKFSVNTADRRLSVDRINNSKGYEEGNLSLSCRRCNSIKSDFFSDREMKELAKEHITPKWKNIYDSKKE
jgi:hypothetical protein